MLGLLLYPQSRRWRYVGGWVITHEWPIEHGWLSSPYGEIVDPTLALFGLRYVNTRYFPGAAFSHADVTFCYEVEQLLSVRHVAPLSYHWSWASDAHEAARRLAYASC
jgi:hypothetical protein